MICQISIKLTAIILATSVLTGCNTIDGVGKDMSGLLDAAGGILQGAGDIVQGAGDLLGDAGGALRSP